MDRTTVSGTVGTGSIPVGGARAHMTLVLGAVLRAPLVRKTQNKCHSFLCASLVRSVQIKRVFTCQNLPEYGSVLEFCGEDRNEPPPNDAIWYAKVRLPYAFCCCLKIREGDANPRRALIYV